MLPFIARKSAPCSGFTLLELLIVVATGGLVIAAISSVITSVVRLQRTQLQAQQLRSDWSRFTTFLSHEVGEGCRVYTKVDPNAVDDPNCPPITSATLFSAGCSVPPPDLLFVIVVPVVPVNDFVPVTRNIVYYRDSSSANNPILRCGPRILASTVDRPDIGGRLDDSSSNFTARLIDGIPVTAEIDPNDPGILSGPSLTITPSITGANLAPFAVRTRSLVIP